MTIAITAIVWILLALVMGFIGSKRRIEFWPAFLYSFFFSVLVGGIITFSYRKKRPEPKGIDALHYNGNAMVYYERGEYDKAISLYNRSLKVEKTANVYFQLACLHALKQEHEDSVKNLQLALKMGYDNFKKIETHKDLKNIRRRKGYQQLKKANFIINEVNKPVNGNGLEKKKSLSRKTFS